jgi:hypothetical protein
MRYCVVLILVVSCRVVLCCVVLCCVVLCCVVLCCVVLCCVVLCCVAFCIVLCVALLCLIISSICDVNILLISKCIFRDKRKRRQRYFSMKDLHLALAFCHAWQFLSHIKHFNFLDFRICSTLELTLNSCLLNHVLDSLTPACFMRYSTVQYSTVQYSTTTVYQCTVHIHHTVHQCPDSKYLYLTCNIPFIHLRRSPSSSLNTTRTDLICTEY